MRMLPRRAGELLGAALRGPVTHQRLFPPTIRQLLAGKGKDKDKGKDGGVDPGTREETTEVFEVRGWIKSVRRQKNVTFAVVTDGSTARGLQAVFPKDVLTADLTNGCSVKLRGNLVESLGAKQNLELLVQAAEVVGKCDPDTYPIQKKTLTVDYLRDWCHLRSRSDKISQMLRVRDSLTRAFNEYFEKEGFLFVHTPILTSSDCEGAGETFRVTTTTLPGDPQPSPENSPQHFFKRDAYLTVSSQLHLEALAASHGRVYTLAPCFRAEPSQTNRHLAEFWMLEAEWAFTRSLEDVCAAVESAVRYAVGRVVVEESERDHRSSSHSSSSNNNSADAAGSGSGSPRDEPLASRAARLFALHSARPWIRMSYAEAISLLKDAHVAQPRAPGRFAFEPEWGRALQSEHERWLAEAVGGPVFVTDYPAAVKPFYMRVNDHEDEDEDDDGGGGGGGGDERERTVACFDLIVPGIGELVGGSLREERLGKLDVALQRHGLSGREEYEWYRDLRRFGGAPHGGFGLGFERLVSALTGQLSVRECIAMPRWAGRMLL